jgi:hypothetical protein
MDITFVISCTKAPGEKMRVCRHSLDFGASQKREYRSRESSPSEIGLRVVGKDQNSASRHSVRKHFVFSGPRFSSALADLNLRR